MSSGLFGSETNVLVVEDEMVLRMRAVDIVEDAGFTAIEAINADEALTILESRSDISLLFSDVQMPGSIDGLKLAHAVHDRWPSIKIILVSGQINVSDADKPVESRFFGKPLEIEQMVAELRDMVGAGSLAIIAKLGVPISETEPESLTAENESLRLLLEQADLDAKALILQVGIDAKEREASDKLQRLIVEELHHRIKNTLAIVGVTRRRASAPRPRWSMGARLSKLDWELSGVPMIYLCRSAGLIPVLRTSLAVPLNPTTGTVSDALRSKARRSQSPPGL
jgi:DNA-binding NtrC family response regulator